MLVCLLLYFHSLNISVAKFIGINFKKIKQDERFIGEGELPP